MMKRLLLLLAICLILPASIFAQAFKVSGKVTDSQTGEPIPGVNIIIKGTTQGATTDFDGKFNIEVPDVIAELQFSFVGYVPEDVKVNGQALLNVSLVPDIKALDEIVVVGYGTIKKTDLTGAVSTVKGEQLRQLASIDVNANLQGKVAGVQVTQNSGDPAGGSKVRIRGIGTVNNSDPLYVIDGIPYSGGIDFLAPTDVESMYVLKDASAKAIYGNRSSNGVIMITTKKGKSGEASFNFNSYCGVQAPVKTLDFVNATEYATLFREAYRNSGTSLTSSQEAMLAVVEAGNFKGTDWQKEVFDYAAPVQNYNLSVSGGSEKSRYSVSGTYFDQKGTLMNTGLKKYLLRLTNDYEFSKVFKGGFTASYVYADFTNTDVNQFSGMLPLAVSIDPITAAWDKSTNNYGNPQYFSQVSGNPAQSADEAKGRKSYQNRLRASLFGEAKIFKSLTFHSNFGMQLDNDHLKNYLPKYKISSNVQRAESELRENRISNYGWTWSNYFNFEKEIGNHSINAMAGTEANFYNNQQLQSINYDIINDPSQYYASAAKDNTKDDVTSTQGESSMLSYYGRINYTFMKRYLLTATARYDGTSRFTKENRWGLFPSFSLGWNIKEEAFLSDISWISSLKIRGGYGEVGNQASAGNYDYVASMSPYQDYTFGNPQTTAGGAMALTLANKDLHWEVAKETNIGFESSLLNNKLDFTIDYFINKTEDMIVGAPQPAYIGATAPRVNIGTMQNKGIEFALNLRGSISKLKYEIGYNMAFIKNEVTSLGGGTSKPGGNVTKLGNVTETAVGQPFPYYTGYKTAGIFKTDQEVLDYTGVDPLTGATVIVQPSAKAGDLKYIDSNGDGKLDALDKYNLGSSFPDFTGGITINLEYNGFDIKAFGQFVYGNEICNSLVLWDDSPTGTTNSLSKRMNRYDAIDNPNGTEPRMNYSEGYYNLLSDRYIQDGSFFRLKNLQVGYTIPSTFSNKYGIKSFRLYVAADNLFTLTKYEGYDPEVGDFNGNPYNAGLDMATWPQSRIFRLGVNLKF